MQYVSKKKSDVHEIHLVHENQFKLITYFLKKKGSKLRIISIKFTNPLKGESTYMQE